MHHYIGFFNDVYETWAIICIRESLWITKKLGGQIQTRVINAIVPMFCNYLSHVEMYALYKYLVSMYVH